MFPGKISDNRFTFLTFSFSCPSRIFTVVSVAVTTQAHRKHHGYAKEPVLDQFGEALVPGRIISGTFKYSEL